MWGWSLSHKRGLGARENRVISNGGRSGDPEQDLGCPGGVPGCRFSLLHKILKAGLGAVEDAPWAVTWSCTLACLWRADPGTLPHPQLSLNNKQLSQMLKSSAPAQEEEEDPLAYYENHTSQIEVGRWGGM